MKRKLGQSGISLMEMTVVVSIVALLAVLAMPAIRALIGSFETSGGAKCMISAALSTARGIAAKEQHYAGIRFQKAYNPDDPDNLLNASQYMIFIVHDFDATGLDPGFRAVDGLQPIKLPESVGVMDLMVRVNHGTHWTAAEDTGGRMLKAVDLDDSNPANIVNGKNIYIMDTTTFSIIFSPSGKMIVHNVRVRNRDGIYQPDNGGVPSKVSLDDIFNSPVNIVNNNTGMFVQDDYAELGLGAEPSRNRFIIYETEKFRQAHYMGRAWTDYLSRAAVEGMICINPYTGTIINR